MHLQCCNVTLADVMDKQDREVFTQELPRLDVTDYEGIEALNNLNSHSRSERRI
jgi:hypothetical protein